MAKNQLSFNHKLDQIQTQSNSLVCVGLDSDITKLPAPFLKKKYPQFEFNTWIIDQTHDLVCAYKPNSAFYEARGSVGMAELEMTIQYLKTNYPEILTIDDAKRADIGNTNLGYIQAIFDRQGFDAVTLHPYLGQEALQPFLDREDKGCFILCRTSNPGAGEFQDAQIVIAGISVSSRRKPGSIVWNSNKSDSASRSKMIRPITKPLWQIVAESVNQKWNKNKNCLLVVGATYPQEMKIIRQLVGEMTFLVPGIGAQGGDLEAVLSAGLNADKKGLIINSARGIIFAGDPRAETQKLKQAINSCRNR